MVSTDGTPGATVDPGAGKSAGWDAVLSESIASTGIDPNSPLPEDPQEPVASASQSLTPESSAGAPAADPASPPVSAPGDGGSGKGPAPVAASAATDPATPTTEIPDSKPFTYPVDGQEKTIEGVFVIPGDGLYVPEAKIPHFQLLASRAEGLERQYQTLQEKHQAQERLSEWRTTGQDGKETVLKGAEGVKMRDLGLSMLRAEVTQLRDIFEHSPTRWLAQDEAGNLVWNTDAFTDWQKGLDQARKIAYHEANSTFSARASAPPPPPPPLTSAELSERSLPTVEAVISSAKVTGLTNEDKAALARLVPRYVVTVTSQNAGQYPNSKMGETVLDYHAFLPEVQDRATLRTATIQAAKAGTDAQTFNAGMQRGRQPMKAPAPPRKPAAPSAPAPAEKRGKGEAWDTVLREAAEGLTF